MASILRVNTLTDASSNNSTAMSTVNQGTAKSWVYLKGTDTFGIQDSFNTRSEERRVGKECRSRWSPYH